MTDKIKNIIKANEELLTKKYLKILTRCNLLFLTQEYVEDKFKRVYQMLIYEEDFETCAQLRKIEEEYYNDLKSKKERSKK